MHAPIYKWQECRFLSTMETDARILAHNKKDKDLQ